MYASSFGLSERPFSITPNPRYLYLSKRHREALAHLLYGVREGGGFVQLTGEVGTGKTTLCRSLLEQLPENVDLALILNPKVSPIELVATICDELDIEYPEHNESIKVLTDRLNKYLLDAHTKGRRVVVVIDEAQNLEVDVLEQVRLLTNLETSSQKLLQIILVGQPELKEILSQQNLRQVAQRVTARYHLVPLSLEETEGYIKHRLTVAGARKMLFSSKAIKLVHRYSRGVPRLINVICDRALLGAFSKDLAHVNEKVLKKAAREVLAETWQPGTWFAIKSWLLQPQIYYMLIAATVALVFILLLPPLLEQMDGRVKVKPPAQNAGTKESLPVPIAKPAPMATETTNRAMEADLDAENSPSVAVPQTAATIASTEAKSLSSVDKPTLDQLFKETNKNKAIGDLAAMWGVDLAMAGPIHCDTLGNLSLQCVEKRGSWSNLKRLNRPAVLTLYSNDGTKYYGVLRAMQGNEVDFSVGDQHFRLDKNYLENLWYGEYLFVWRLPKMQREVIRPGVEGEDVTWLREQLQKIEGVSALSEKPMYFDSVLEERVRIFQRRYGLDEDGVVGLQTLIYLNNLAADENVPSLLRQAGQ